MHGFVLTRYRLRREVDCLSRLLASRGLDVVGLPEWLGQLAEGQALLCRHCAYDTCRSACQQMWNKTALERSCFVERKIHQPTDDSKEDL
jgi:hypothetical protein